MQFGLIDKFKNDFLGGVLSFNKNGSITLTKGKRLKDMLENAYDGITLRPGQKKDRTSLAKRDGEDKESRLHKALGDGKEKVVGAIEKLQNLTEKRKNESKKVRDFTEPDPKKKKQLARRKKIGRQALKIVQLDAYATYLEEALEAQSTYDVALKERKEKLAEINANFLNASKDKTKDLDMLKKAKRDKLEGLGNTRALSLLNTVSIGSHAGMQAQEYLEACLAGFFIRMKNNSYARMKVPNENLGKNDTKRTTKGNPIREVWEQRMGNDLFNMTHSARLRLQEGFLAMSQVLHMPFPYYMSQRRSSAVNHPRADDRAGSRDAPTPTPSSSYRASTSFNEDSSVLDSGPADVVTSNTEQSSEDWYSYIGAED
jgi:hypothetical protein